MIRADSNAAALAPAATRIVRRIAPTAPIENVLTVAQIRDESVAPRRLNALLVSSFGILALIIAAVGIAGVLAFSVSARTNEIGIRMSLGADSGRVQRMILSRGRRARGDRSRARRCAARSSPRGVMRGLLFGVAPHDPATLRRRGGDDGGGRDRRLLDSRAARGADRSGRHDAGLIHDTRPHDVSGGAHHRRKHRNHRVHRAVRDEGRSPASQERDGVRVCDDDDGPDGRGHGGDLGQSAGDEHSCGLLTAYLVITGLTTVRPLAAGARWLDATAMCVALTVGLVFSTFGVEAAMSPRGLLHGMPVYPYAIFGAIALLAAAGDARLIRSGGAQLLRGVPRLRRHLWRMTTALLIAAFSFFLGQAKVIPKPIRIYPLLAIPPLVVLAALVYWLWRTRAKRARAAGSLARLIGPSERTAPMLDSA